MKTLLLTPPFTQLNTPYPATAYLKGFLNSIGQEAFQADLGIEVILRLFSRKRMETVFTLAAKNWESLSENGQRMLQLKQHYLRCIDPVILFLQNRNPTLAHNIVDRSFLPEADRFAELDDLDWAFGTMGIHDHARHLATLFLEDIGDLITEAIDPHFGFSRYAERLGRTATHFDEIESALNAPNSLVSDILLEILEEKILQFEPNFICISVPFPGNLFGAFKCGQFIKSKYPKIPIALGGGFANTELRSLKEPRVFDYLDFVVLDDGEAPLQILIEFLEGKRQKNQLKRVFLREEDRVAYFNAAKEKDVPQRETGTPDYSDLPIHNYLSVIEIVNPMHSLWSNGRWNKLTLAHGCYWGKCTFCDISLDYIKRYEPMTAALLCDQIERIIEQTGQTGFHFVDEAAPPAVMRDLALEIIKRGLIITWWTNIRFEKSFTPDLCRLLKASGCIAVSGGLEVASDRLLELMQKGVTVAQVARVANAFTEAGIMVHAYLMYGFPTQTAQETIDALEMVRQLFELGIVQSGFWHRFAMTAHSPVGLNPASFGVLEIGPKFGGFADNDRYHDDPKGADHDLFAEGLRKSLFNYMHGAGFEIPLSKWFDIKVPRTKIHPDYIEAAIHFEENIKRSNAFVVWLGSQAQLLEDSEDEELASIFIPDPREDREFEMSLNLANWLMEILPSLSPGNVVAFTKLSTEYESKNIPDFPDFDSLIQSEMGKGLQEAGLLVL